MDTFFANKSRFNSVSCILTQIKLTKQIDQFSIPNNKRFIIRRLIFLHIKIKENSYVFVSQKVICVHISFELSRTNSELRETSLKRRNFIECIAQIIHIPPMLRTKPYSSQCSQQPQQFKIRILKNSFGIHSNI